MFFHCLYEAMTPVIRHVPHDLTLRYRRSLPLLSERCHVRSVNFVTSGQNSRYLPSLQRHTHELWSRAPTKVRPERSACGLEEGTRDCSARLAASIDSRSIHRGRIEDVGRTIRFSGAVASPQTRLRLFPLGRGDCDAPSA